MKATKNWANIAYNEDPDFFTLLGAQDQLLHEKHLLEREPESETQLIEVENRLNKINELIWQNL